MKQMIESTAPNSLAFSIDDESGKTIARVTDAQTGEMIRQIPSKELLEIARSLAGEVCVFEKPAALESAIESLVRKKYDTPEWLRMR